MDEEKGQLLWEEWSTSSAESDTANFIITRWRQHQSMSLRHQLSWAYFVFLHAFLITVSFQLVSQRFSKTPKSNDEPYSPATTSVQYVMRTERSNGSLMHSPYTGFPNEAITRAWEDLINPMIFNASEEEVLASGSSLDDSVKVANGGYLASLGVYHEIHCLRRMRLWLHRDTYYPNATKEDEIFMQVHIGHCIEILRLSAMCNVDVGMYTFFWDHPNAVKPQSRSTSPRKCVDWKAFEQWSVERKIDTHSLLIQ